MACGLVEPPPRYRCENTANATSRHGRSSLMRSWLVRAIQTAIGGLIIHWANSESVFLAMLQTLLPDSGRSAAIIWFSQRTTQARLDLLAKLSRERITNAALVGEIEKAISAFRGLTGVRNFYCHAIYQYDLETKHLTGVHGTTLAQDGTPLRSTNKPLNLGTINEITSATVDRVR